MVINSFNLIWFVLIAMTVLAIVFLTRKYKDKTEKEKLHFLLILSSATFVLWILYKVVLSQDESYADLFFFWNELPFYPCNTIIWLSIIASWKNNKQIMAYAFYFGCICAFLALLMPSEGFYGVSFFLPRCLGYYFTHMLVIVIGALFATFGLIEINRKSALQGALWFFGCTVFFHIVNTFMRLTGIYPDCSYYYTYGSENSALQLVNSIIPINLVYMFPIHIVTYFVFLLEQFIINKLKGLKK